MKYTTSAFHNDYLTLSADDLARLERGEELVHGPLHVSLERPAVRFLTLDTRPIDAVQVVVNGAVVARITLSPEPTP